MTYLPPGNQDPYGQQPQPPQDPYSGQQQPNPYAQQPAPGSPATPSYGQASTPPYGQASTPPYDQTSAQPYGQTSSPSYGQPYAYGAAATPAQNSMALTAMILSLVGIAVWITAPIGAILGHISLKQIRQTGESGEGMAKTGIIVGWIITGFGVLCCVGYVVFFVILASSAGTSSFD